MVPSFLCLLLLCSDRLCFILGAYSQVDKDPGKDQMAEDWKMARRQRGKEKKNKHEDRWKLVLKHYY